MHLRQRDPVPRLLEWLGLALSPLGVSASHVLLHPGRDDRPWYAPPLVGGAVGEDGLTARQTVFDPIKYEGGPEFGRAVVSSYDSAMSSRDPMRTALAGSGPIRGPWQPIRSYLLPYASNLPAQTVALQHAAALQDLTTASFVAQGDSYIVRHQERAFGVLNGKALGSLRVTSVTAEDLHSLLICDRLVDASRMAPVALSVRQCFDSVRDRLAQPDLVRDAVAILGLLTARAWTFDGNDRLEHIGHERLRNLVAKHWNTPREVSDETVREARSRRDAAVEQARRANLAIDALVDSSLEDATRVMKMREILVPEVWSELTFRQRVTHRPATLGLKLTQASKEKALEALEKNLRRLKPKLKSE